MKKIFLLFAVCFFALSAPAKETPWSAWRNAYNEYEKAEKARDAGDYLNAAKGFKKSLELYEFVREQRPDWNQKVILRRIADCKQELGKVEGFLTPVAATKSAQTLPSPVLRTTPKVASKKADTQEVAELKKKIAEIDLELQTLRQKEKSRRDLESEIAMLIRDQHLAKERQAMLEEKLRQAEKNRAQLSEEAQKELQNQLVQSKMECESLKVKLAEAQEKAQKAQSNADTTLAQRKFAESAIQAAQEKLLRQERETADIRRAEEESRHARERLQKELEEIKKEFAATSAELKETQKNFADAQEKIRQSAEAEKGAGAILSEENRRLTDKLNALQMRYDQLNAAFRDLRVRNTQDQTLAEQMKTLAERSESARRMLEKQQISQEKQIKDLRTETTAQMEEIATQKTRIETLENDLKRAVAQKEVLQHRLQQRDADDYRAAADIAAKQKAWTLDKGKLQEEIASQKGETVRLQHQLEEKTAQLTTLTRAREKVVQENETLQQQLNALLEVQKEFIQLQQNFSAAQKDLQECRIKLEIAQKEHKELLALRQEQKQVNQLKMKLSDEERLSAELADANAALTARLAEALKLKDEVVKLRAEAAQVIDLRATVERLKTQNQELAKYRDLEKELAAAKQTIISLESLQGKLDAALKQQILDQQKINALQEEIAEKTAKISDADKRNDTQKSETDALRRDLENFRAAKEKEVETLRGDLVRLRAEKEKLASDDTWQKKFLTEQAEKNKLREENVALKQQMAAIQAQSQSHLAEAEKTKNFSDKKILTAQTEGEKLRTENAALKEQMIAMQAQAQSQLAEAEKEKKSADDVWQKKIGTAQAAETALRKENAALQQEIILTRQTQTRQKERLAEAEKAAKEYREKAIPLQTEINRLHTQVAALKQQEAKLGQLAEKQKLAEKENEKLRALNASLIQNHASGKEIELLKTKLAEAESFRSEVDRLRLLNQELRRENKELELAVLRPVENSFQFDSTTELLETPEVLISAGMRAEKENRISTAIWNYENALKKAPDNAFAAKRLGILLLQREEFERAAVILKVANRLAPKDPEVAIAAARAANACQRYGSALVYLDPWLKDPRPGMETLLTASDAYAGSGKRDKAEKLLRFAVRYYGHSFVPQMALARFLADDATREEEALQLYENLRVAGALPDPKLEIRFAGRLDERRELAHFLNDAAEEAANRNDWTTTVWYRRQAAEMKRDEKWESTQLAFARYMNGETAAALEELSLHRATVEGQLIAALCHLRDQDRPAFQAALKYAKKLNHDQMIELTASWRLLLVELKKAAVKEKAILEVVR